jgi:protein-disulfide isomerase
MKTIIAAALAALTAAPALAQALDEDRIKALALEAIRENPGIVMEAVEALQAQQAEAERAAIGDVLADRREELVADPNAPVLGNPEGDVAVVEFFDYNCPYCKRAAEPVARLLDADEGVRLVYREWPILGEGSLFAARAALAARAQDKYEEMHEALMGYPQRVDEEVVMDAAERLGLDLDRLREDMDAPEVEDHIAQSMALARALGVTGTPAFVIGDQLAPGLIPFEELQRLVAEAREEG